MSRLRRIVAPLTLTAADASTVDSTGAVFPLDLLTSSV